MLQKKYSQPGGCKIQLTRGRSWKGSRNPKGRIKTPLPYTVGSKDIVSCLLMKQNRRYIYYVIKMIISYITVFSYRPGGKEEVLSAINAALS